MQALRTFKRLHKPQIYQEDQQLVKNAVDPLIALEFPLHVARLKTKSLTLNASRFSPLLRGTDYQSPASLAQMYNLRRTSLLSRAQSNRSLYRSYATDLPEHIEVGLPALSPTMEKGNLAKWRKKEGEKVTAGDVLAEVETDKATADFETTDDGWLAKILVPEKTEGLDVGTPIAIIVENEADIAAFKDYKGAAAAAPKAEAPKEAPKQEKPAEKPQQTAEKPAEKKSAPAQPTGRVVPGAPPPPAPRSGASSPAARAAAVDQGVDISSLQGSGPNGRIIKSDVAGGKPAQAAAPKSATAQAPAGAFTEVPNSQIRKVIARRLTESKSTIPHYYLSIECNVDQLIKARTHLNAKANGQYKLSVNDFVVKASAAALRRVPEVNSSWTEDAIRRYHSVDINVAVNTDKGLLTPLIQNADRAGLASINNTVKTLAEKGKEGKLSPAEQASGTFTVSNLGMFGIKQFCAVINPPQACILAVGGTEQRVVVGEGDKFTTGNFMTVTLSCDHRVVDGAIGARWLQAFKEYIEDPSKLLL